MLAAKIAQAQAEQPLISGARLARSIAYGGTGECAAARSDARRRERYGEARGRHARRAAAEYARL